MKMNPQLTIDLRAVSHATFFWKNQLGDVRRCKPLRPTVNGSIIPMEMHGNRQETMLQVAKRRGLLDTWTPVCIYQFRNNHSFTFIGDKARKRWKEYNAHIYDKS